MASRKCRNPTWWRVAAAGADKRGGQESRQGQANGQVRRGAGAGQEAGKGLGWAPFWPAVSGCEGYAAKQYISKATAAAGECIATVEAQQQRCSQVKTMVGWSAGSTSRTRYSSAPGLSSLLQATRQADGRVNCGSHCACPQNHEAYKSVCLASPVPPARPAHLTLKNASPRQGEFQCFCMQPTRINPTTRPFYAPDSKESQPQIGGDLCVSIQAYQLRLPQPRPRKLRQRLGHGGGEEQGLAAGPHVPHDLCGGEAGKGRWGASHLNSSTAACGACPANPKPSLTKQNANKILCIKNMIIIYI